MSSKIIEETLGLIEERTPGLDETSAENVCIGLLSFGLFDISRLP